MSWTIPPTDFADVYEEDHAEMVQALAIAFWTRVTIRTPVDTGVARGNWHMTMNPSDKIYKTKRLKKPLKKKPKPYPTYYVQNNIEYIIPLEYGTYGTGKYATALTTRDGYSVQAPSGMFRVTLAELK